MSLDKAGRDIQIGKVWWIVWLGIAALLLSPGVRACSVAYTIWGIRDKSADPMFRFMRHGKAGYVDSSGEVVLQPTIRDRGSFLGEFHEGLVGIKDDHGFQYLDRSGKVVLHADARLALNFSGGLAPASPLDGAPTWGFINRTGAFAIPPKFLEVEGFSDGLAKVSVSAGSEGYIDHQGNFVIPPRLSYGSSFHEGRAAVIIGGPCQIVNGGSCGRAEFRAVRILPNYDCRYAYIDTTGKPISDLRFDDAKDFSGGLAPVRNDRHWGYVDRSGQIAISPKFDSAEEFSESLALVYQNGKAGFIDASGDFVIPPQFESADSFSNGRALVTETNSQGMPTCHYIDRAGKTAFPGKFSAATSFSHGLAHVMLNGGSSGTFAWIDTNGKPVFTYSLR